MLRVPWFMGFCIHIGIWFSCGCFHDRGWRKVTLDTDIHSIPTQSDNYVSLLTPNSSAIILTVTQRSSCIRFLTFAMSPSSRKENGRPGLASSSIVSTPLLNRAYHLNICARDKQLSLYTCLINSTVSTAVFPSLKQNLMFALCSMPLLWPRPLTTCTTWRRISRHAQRGSCCVARLQMKVGHTDGMHCFTDRTSILVKIKSISLYNCRTV